MIEINLIPDVKLELLRAKKTRSMVVSAAILISIVSGSLVALISVYAYGVQGYANYSADKTIDEEGKKLSAVADLPEMLTIQNQLKELSDKQQNKTVTSRVFDLLTTIIPDGDNEVKISKIDLDTEEGTIGIEAEAKNGFEALEVFKKTIASTTLQYSVDGEKMEPVPIAVNIQSTDVSLSESSEGGKVLRFSISFEYAEELFSPTSENGKIIAPDKQNATDSAKSVPKSLFTDSVKKEDKESQ